LKKVEKHLEWQTVISILELWCFYSEVARRWWKPTKNLDTCICVLISAGGMSFYCFQSSSKEEGCVSVRSGCTETKTRYLTFLSCVSKNDCYQSCVICVLNETNLQFISTAPRQAPKISHKNHYYGNLGLNV
jgi:hypothetical protein